MYVKEKVLCIYVILTSIAIPIYFKKRIARIVLQVLLEDPPNILMSLGPCVIEKIIANLMFKRNSEGHITVL